MAEWLKAHAWKACIPQGIQGSNPCLSANNLFIVNDLLEIHQVVWFVIMLPFADSKGVIERSWWRDLSSNLHDL